MRTTVRRLGAAAKYRQVHVDTIEDVVTREAVHASSPADLERRARLKLHKIIAGYLLTARPARLLRGLDEAVAAGEAALLDWCRTALAGHFSTAERLSDLDLLYPAIVELTGPVDTVADLACALNPLTVPWLRMTTGARYLGYDLNQSYVDIGNEFLRRAALPGCVEHHDVLTDPADIHADVALLLKTYHCIEDRRPGAALRLVDELGVAQVVVSFPVRTMSGRMASFTGAHIDRLIGLAGERGWAVRRAALTNEEMLVIKK